MSQTYRTLGLNFVAISVFLGLPTLTRCQEPSIPVRVWDSLLERQLAILDQQLVTMRRDLTVFRSVYFPRNDYIILTLHDIDVDTAVAKLHKVPFFQQNDLEILTRRANRTVLLRGDPRRVDAAFGVLVYLEADACTEGKIYQIPTSGNPEKLAKRLKTELEFLYSKSFGVNYDADKQVIIVNTTPEFLPKIKAVLKLLEKP